MRNVLRILFPTWFGAESRKIRISAYEKLLQRAVDENTRLYQQYIAMVMHGGDEDIFAIQEISEQRERAKEEVRTIAQKLSDMGVKYVRSPMYYLESK